MTRNAARDLVFTTLRDVGVPLESLTRKTKLATILQGEPREDFVRILSEKAELLTIAASDVGLRTVGQFVRMVASQLPGDDRTKGPRNR